MLTEVRSLVATLNELRQYDKDRLRYLTSRFDREGDVFSIDERDHVVGDGRLAKGLLSRTDLHNFTDPELYATRNQLSGAAAYAERWEPARDAIRGVTRRKESQAYANQVADSFVDYVRSSVGMTIDVTSVLKGASGAAIAQLFVGSQGREVSRYVARSVAANLPLMHSSVLRPKWSRSSAVRAQRTLSAELKAQLAAIVDERISGHREEDVLQAMVDRPSGGQRQQCIDALQVSLLASFGVPGVAMSWMLAELHKQPTLARVMRDEASSCTSAGESLGRPIFGHLINEALRMHPPAWLLTRIIGQDTTLSRELVARQSSVVNLIIYRIHRQPSMWQKPNTFLLDRWNAGSPLVRGAFIPFGSGPRVCSGAQLGTVQLHAFLWSYLTHFDTDEVCLDSAPKVESLLEPTCLTGRLRSR